MQPPAIFLAMQSGNNIFLLFVNRFSHLTVVLATNLVPLLRHRDDMKNTTNHVLRKIWQHASV